MTPFDQQALEAGGRHERELTLADLVKDRSGLTEEVPDVPHNGMTIFSVMPASPRTARTLPLDRGGRYD